MKTYETKAGTAQIISGRVYLNGNAGVYAMIGKQRAFVAFAGKPDLEAAFPEVATGAVEAGHYVKNGRLVRKSADMDSDYSKN
jgi:hypothetical protein